MESSGRLIKRQEEFGRPLIFEPRDWGITLYDGHQENPLERLEESLERQKESELRQKLERQIENLPEFEHHQGLKCLLELEYRQEPIRKGLQRRQGIHRQNLERRHKLERKKFDRVSPGGSIRIWEFWMPRTRDFWRHRLVHEQEFQREKLEYEQEYQRQDLEDEQEFQRQELVRQELQRQNLQFLLRISLENTVSIFLKQIEMLPPSDNLIWGESPPTIRDVWNEGMRAIRKLFKNQLPRTLKEVCACLLVANAMREVGEYRLDPGDTTRLFCSKQEYVCETGKVSIRKNKG
jgi:hypothetical protein